MQLKKSHNTPRNIRRQLAAATCGLLAGAGHAGGLVASGNNWKIDSALLIYAEKDRVALVEPVLSLSKEIDDDEFINVRIVADVLTGASPNGAVPADTPQTFTTPSGKSTYTEAANTTPLDDTFKDSRGALNVEWDTPLGNNLRGTFGGNFSNEHDYLSTGFSANFAQDINQRHTTLALGLSFNNDTVSPEGGVPVGLTVMPVYPGVKATDGSKQDKTVKEVLFGVTQIIDRSSLMQLNYSRGQSDGYLTDPYKILSVLEDDGTGNLRGTTPYVYESRPDQRNYQILFWKGVHQLPNENVLNLSYRYFWDDWGIQSHTVDLRYRFDFAGGHYLQPHLRYYQQAQADFYRQTLIDGEETTLAYASADYRLGEFTTQTIGVKYGYQFHNGAELNLRVEMIEQNGKDRSADAIGKLQNQQLFPDNEAYLLQAGVSLDSDMIINYVLGLFK
ncbi:MAG: DUF3570 domain-containing protein [Gammaproteobacteria bacterium]|nr:DUF3570 domain-containing protein [Gammaproteobacteria bacterium]